MGAKDKKKRVENTHNKKTILENRKKVCSSKSQKGLGVGQKKPATHGGIGLGSDAFEGGKT